MAKVLDISQLVSDKKEYPSLDHTVKGYST